MFTCLNVLLLATSKMWVRNVWIRVNEQEIAEISALTNLPNRNPSPLITSSILCSLFVAATLDDNESELPSMSPGDVALIGQAAYLCLPRGWKRLSDKELSDYCQMEVLERIDHCYKLIADFN